MYSKLKSYLRSTYDYMKLPTLAKDEHLRDKINNSDDPGIDLSIKESINWLCRAQDKSLLNDGGVARHFSLIDGWSSSYPETTGYIVPTFIEYSKFSQDKDIHARAKKMLDWLVSIQFPDGGFQGGLVDSLPKVPVTFNTGQILLGLASGVKEFGNEYYDSMCKAADWLVKTMDDDGCWRQFPTPFAADGEKAYETHVAWGLFEAARIEPNKGYAEAAMKNIKWALRSQKENGWFYNCCLEDPSKPLTHTIGYVLRGVLEAYRYNNDAQLLEAARKTSDSLLDVIDLNTGFISGRLNTMWEDTVPWACLTGTVQIAYCWMKMYQYTKKEVYLQAAYAANKYVRCTIHTNGNEDMRGGVKGSFPVSGEYGHYQMLNWAAKFFIDAQMLEKEIRNNS